MPIRCRVKAVCVKATPCQHGVVSNDVGSSRRRVNTASCNGDVVSRPWHFNGVICQLHVVTIICLPMRCRANTTPCQHDVVSTRCRVTTAPCQKKVPCHHGVLSKRHRVKTTPCQHYVVSRRHRVNTVSSEADIVSGRHRPKNVSSQEQHSIKTASYHDHTAPK